MKNLRSALGAGRQRLIRRLRTGTALERSIYYTFVSDAFRRERKVVARGHRKYLVDVEAGRHEFLIRRNIHMIEKGLTMRPRRVTFAVEYIEETVALATSLVKLSPTPLSPAVLAWVHEVLERYFAATVQSENSRIRRAEKAYRAIEWTEAPDGVSGPTTPQTDDPSVGIEDLTALAVRRKSVRWFLDRPVPREVVDKAMLVAAEAPSACNRQPFSFRVFDEPAMVEAVARIPMGTAGYGQGLRGIVVIVGDLSAFIDERDRHLIYTDGCLAAMSFILGLEAQGVASVCINWPDIAQRDQRMNDLLGLTEHERVVMLMGYGYADRTGHTPHSAKRSLENLRTFNVMNETSALFSTSTRGASQ